MFSYLLIQIKQNQRGWTITRNFTQAAKQVYKPQEHSSTLFENSPQVLCDYFDGLPSSLHTLTTKMIRT